MSPLILLPTDTSQWHALVYEAQAASKLILNEDTESYLVFLLIRFTQTTELIESILALDFLESMQQENKRPVDQFQSLGDKSLLLSGLFPGITEKRGVCSDYYSKLGQAAYQTAGKFEDHPQAPLYLTLSEEFFNLQQILQAMRHTSLLPQHYI